MAFVEVVTKGGNLSVPSEPYAFEEAGQTLTGKLVHRAEIATEYGPKMKYVLETEDGNKSILGSFQLNEKLALIEDKKTVRITFTGRAKTANGKVKLFQVAVDDGT
jgi:hypothetical protein